MSAVSSGCGGESAARWVGAPRRPQLVLCLALCAFALACGRKGPVKPPEFVRPAPIEDVQASNGSDDIVVSWGRPSRYADGSRMTDLGEFRVERASGGSADFQVIAVLPIEDQDRFRQIKRFRFADRGVIEGESYRYRVVSSTVDGYVSRPSNAVEIVRAATVVPASTPTAEGRGKR